LVAQNLPKASVASPYRKANLLIKVPPKQLLGGTLMVGVARIELATPAMSRQGLCGKMAENCHFSARY
jgi:hypothetical protein